MSPFLGYTQVSNPGGSGGSSGAVAQGSTTSGQSGPLVQCAATTSAPTYTTGQTDPISCDTSGSVRVNVVSGSTGNAAAGNTGSSVPTQAGYNGVNVGGTLRGSTAVNPSGSVYATQTDITSVGGTTVIAATTGGTLPVTGAVVETAAPAPVAGTYRMLSMDTSGAIRVNATTSALPSGAATSANQSTEITDLNTLTTSGGGGYVRQDSTATIAKESGGNLASIKTDVDTLAASSAGGYVRQDSTGTIAKETGGNLTTIAGAVTSSKFQDNTAQIGGVAPSVQTLGAATLSLAGSGAVFNVINYDGQGNPILNSNTLQIKNGVGLAISIYCGTATEIQGLTSFNGAGSSNLTWMTPTGSTFTASAGNRIEIHSYQTGNTGATNLMLNVTMDNPSPTLIGYMLAPTSTTPFGGSNVTLPTPMFTIAQNKAVSVQPISGTSQTYVTAQGCLVP